MHIKVWGNPTSYWQNRHYKTSLLTMLRWFLVLHNKPKFHFHKECETKRGIWKHQEGGCLQRFLLKNLVSRLIFNQAPQRYHFLWTSEAHKDWLWVISMCSLQTLRGIYSRQVSVQCKYFNMVREEEVSITWSEGIYLQGIRQSFPILLPP